MRLGFKWIPEEDQQIDDALSERGANLRIASNEPAQEARDRQTDCILEQGPRGALRQQAESVGFELRVRAAL
jgi:hypothetical protein